MPYKEPKIEKAYYTISEVAQMFDVNASLIRHWDREFPSLKPAKNKKGNRLFTPSAVEHFRLIYHLVKERGMTLKGAQQLLAKNKDGATKSFEVTKMLTQIKDQLIGISNELDNDQERTQNEA
ncbi:MAG: MerR family transcriptional regulator [Prolixibacteraceae bacterium]|nr:MerR family transcriptional regulator [Prolixibacteraceae bacterium]